MSLAGQVGHTSYPSRISVPSRGSCFLGKHNLENVVRLGSAFLAGAFGFWENMSLRVEESSLVSGRGRLAHFFSHARDLALSY